MSGKARVSCPARARDLGFVVGHLPPGRLNAITDVTGVAVGHTTVVRGEPGSDEAVARTGVTVVMPHLGNLFRERLYGAVSPFNGYGQVTGSLVIDEWGLIGSPIVITDTVHVGIGYSAVIDYMVAQDEEVGRADVPMPIVAECDDGFLNDNRERAMGTADVLAAIKSAVEDQAVEEGSVGAGTGTQLFGYKGGIGTASRLVGEHTVGVLLNTNYGHQEQLRIAGVEVGRALVRQVPAARCGEGSCVAVVATDAPLHPLQLRRLARRVDAGLARTGSVGHDGSGEISIAFSTANVVPREQPAERSIRLIPEGQFWRDGTHIDILFAAVSDATEEAALNALLGATTLVGRDGNTLTAISDQPDLGGILDRIRAYRAVVP